MKLGSLVQGRETEQRFTLSDVDSTWPDARVAKSRSCTGRILPSGRVLPSGQGRDSTELLVHCIPSLHGPFRETLWLQREEPMQRVAIMLEGRVEPLLMAVPPMVDLTVPFGEQRAQVLRFTGELASSAHPKPRGAVPDFVGIQEGADGVFTILSRAKTVGAHDATIEFATGLSQPSIVQVPVRVRVSGTLDVVPNNPYINLRGKGDKSVRLAVSSKQTDFTLFSASVRTGPFRVEVEPTPRGEPASVLVSLLEERLSPTVRGVAGEIVLRSNDRTEPKKRIKVFGFGKPSVR